MNNAVPLICDPVPGLIIVMECAGSLAPDLIADLRRVYHLSGRRSAVYLSRRGVEVRSIPGSRTEWPDAEFCAA